MYKLINTGGCLVDSFCIKYNYKWPVAIYNPGQNYVDTLAVYDLLTYNLFTYYVTFTQFLPEYTQPPLSP